MAKSIHEITGAIGGHTRASRISDWDEAMAPAWQGQADKFEKLVDPEGTLPEAERKRRAKSARSAEMRRVALIGWQRRRAQAAAS